MYKGRKEIKNVNNMRILLVFSKNLESLDISHFDDGNAFVCLFYQRSSWVEEVGGFISGGQKCLILK